MCPQKFGGVSGDWVSDAMVFAVVSFLSLLGELVEREREVFCFVEKEWVDF